jgi:DNA-binding XRE family transcriptional regulator
MSQLQDAITATQLRNAKQTQQNNPGYTPFTFPNPTNFNTRQTHRDNLRIQIKQLRKAKGWTQRELAKHSGYSQGTITRAEKHLWVSLDCVIGIANALGLNLKIT